MRAAAATQPCVAPRTAAPPAVPARRPPPVPAAGATNAGVRGSHGGGATGAATGAAPGAAPAAVAGLLAAGRRLRRRREAAAHREASRVVRWANALARVPRGGDEASQKLLLWAREEGAEISPKLKYVPTEGPRGPRQVVCSSDIEEDEVLVRLPAALTLSVDMSPDSKPPGGMEELTTWWYEHQRASVRLAAVLVWQREKFQPYIDMLPALVGIQSPWLWDDDTLEFIPTALANKAKSRRVAMESAWNDIVYEGLDQKIPRDLFYRAHHAVASRAFTGARQAPLVPLFGGATAAAAAAAGAAFSGAVSFGDASIAGGTAVAACGTAGVIASQGEVLCLLPVVDQMNHDSRTTTKLDFNPLSGGWELRAGSSVAAGSEVTISYGKKGNDTLLLQHGFVEEDNPYEELSLPMPGAYWMKNEAKGAKDMRGKDGKKSMDIKFSRKGKAIPMEEGRFKKRETLWDWLVFLVLGDPESFKDDPKTFGKICIETLEGELAQRFQEDADGGILESLESSPTAELLVQWRREKRRLLGEAMQRYERYREIESETDDETRRLGDEFDLLEKYPSDTFLGK